MVHCQNLKPTRSAQGPSGMIHGVAAIFEQVMVQIDFHRAGIGARAAKG